MSSGLVGSRNTLSQALATKYSRSPPYSRCATTGFPDDLKSAIASRTSCRRAQYAEVKPDGLTMTPVIRWSAFAFFRFSTMALVPFRLAPSSGSNRVSDEASVRSPSTRNIR